MRVLRLCATVLVVTVVGGCGRLPLAPDNPNAPSISATVPADPTISDTAQSVTVTGSRFLMGLQLTVVRPRGGIITLQGSDIQSLTSTSFQVSLTFDVAGLYQLTVTNVDGSSSSPFVLTPR